MGTSDMAEQERQRKVKEIKQKLKKRNKEVMDEVRKWRQATARQQEMEAYISRQLTENEPKEITQAMETTKHKIQEKVINQEFELGGQIDHVSFPQNAQKSLSPLSGFIFSINETSGDSVHFYVNEEHCRLMLDYFEELKQTQE